MFSITLKPTDSIETVLPLVERAMESGEICRINNIDCLGRLGVMALRMLATNDSLLDGVSGKMFHPRPGFCLIGVDDAGLVTVLA